MIPTSTINDECNAATEHTASKARVMHGHNVKLSCNSQAQHFQPLAEVYETEAGNDIRATWQLPSTNYSHCIVIMKFDTAPPQQEACHKR